VKQRWNNGITKKYLQKWRCLNITQGEHQGTLSSVDWLRFWDAEVTVQLTTLHKEVDIKPIHEEKKKAKRELLLITNLEVDLWC